MKNVDILLPPDDAFKLSYGEYVFFIWPTLRNLIPLVNMHIEFTGDIDLPCKCRIAGTDRDTAYAMVDALRTSKQMALEMMEFSGWRIEGEPIYPVSCTHDLDPRGLDIDPNS